LIGLKIIFKSMKIAIVSDTHDNLANLDKLLSFVKKEKITAIFHCGDFTMPETLVHLVSKFDGELFLSLGNADLKEEILEIFSKREGLTIFEDIGSVQLENKKIIFSHFLENIKNELKNYDFAFFGHTHKPSLKIFGKTMVLNPGNLAGLYYKATFAILDLKTESPQLKIVDIHQKFSKSLIAVDKI